MGRASSAASAVSAASAAESAVSNVSAGCAIDSDIAKYLQTHYNPGERHIPKYQACKWAVATSRAQARSIANSSAAHRDTSHSRLLDRKGREKIESVTTAAGNDVVQRMEFISERTMKVRTLDLCFCYLQ